MRKIPADALRLPFVFCSIQHFLQGFKPGTRKRTQNERRGAIRAIGQEGFCTEELSVTEVYETGAFIAAGARPVPFELHYMPKGSLYTGGWRIFFFLDDVGPVRGPETAEITPRNDSPTA